jgi:putative ABC transport system substrate-binding protein
MRRRGFIAGLAGMAAWPLAARAQQPAMPVRVARQHGRVDRQPRFGIPPRPERGWLRRGRTVAIEFRFAGDQLDRLRALAADLVRRRVAAIVVNTATTVRAATDHFCQRRRSGRSRLRHQRQPAGRQRCWRKLYHRPAEPKAPGTAA